MKQFPVHPLLWLLAILTGLAAMPPKRPTLYLIGDSTVKNSSDKGEGGMWGWGHYLPAHFDTTKISIENHAIGGRSSRNFLTEGRWERIMARLQPGDFVMMQFGHNDGGAVNDTIRARGTIKGIGEETQEIDNLITKKHEVVHSYGWYMRKYVQETKAKGATPIVLSLVPRNVWKAGKVERSTGSYGTWAAQVAQAENAYFIDLNERVAAKYDAIGDSAKLQATYFVKDHTHTNGAGARVNAATVVEGLKQLKNCPLNRYVLAPNKAAAIQSPIETGSVKPMPAEWIDKDTGHKVVRLSNGEGSSESFYFHNNPFVSGVGKEGDRMVFYHLGAAGRRLAAVNLKTRQTEFLTGPLAQKGGEIVAPKHREVIYQSRDSVMATHIDTKKTRLLFVFPAGYKASITSLNADETLLAGSQSGEEAREILKRYPEKKDFFTRIFEAKVPHSLFTVNLKTGQLKTIHQENTWLGHVQFSPTDPDLLMFCHEGPWHLVDRIWHINVKTGATKLVHKRTVEGEIAGHEFFSPDGKTVWFDVQKPRSVTFYLAGYEISTGKEKLYSMTRDEWSIHFNVSPDQTLFAGDGGDPGQVAKAVDGMWLYLFRPDGDKLRSERLVNMKHHGYKLEPNVHFSPDGNWIIFRANFEGQSQVYAVEVAANRLTDSGFSKTKP